MLVSLLFPLAHADPAAAPSSEDDADTGHDHRPHGLVEIRAINGASFAEGEAAHVVGTGLSVELYALHHQLGLELATSALTSGTHSIVPIEFIVKHPFHVSEHVEPYIGVGPMLVAVLDETPGWHPGGVAAVGTALWTGPHLAMVIEANSSLARLGDGAHADLEALASIAYRY